MTDPETLAEGMRIAQDEAQENWQSVKKWKARAERAESALAAAEAQGEAKGRTRIEELEREVKDQLNEYIEVAHAWSIRTEALERAVVEADAKGRSAGLREAAADLELQSFGDHNAIEWLRRRADEEGK